MIKQNNVNLGLSTHINIEKLGKRFKLKCDNKIKLGSKRKIIQNTKDPLKKMKKNTGMSIHNCCQAKDIFKKIPRKYKKIV